MAIVENIDTDTELKAFYQDVVDDQSDSDSYLASLFSQAKNKLERRYKPPFARDQDATKTHASGDTYLTTKALPEGFREMLELYVGTVQYYPVPFDKRIFHRNSSRRYYIDHRNSTFAICGSGGAGETITQIFLIKSNDFTEDTLLDGTTNTLSYWPSEFRALIAYHAAFLKAGVDADDATYRMSATHRAEYNDLMESFTDWMADQKLAEMNHRAGFAPDDIEDFDGELRRNLPYF